MSKKLPVFAPSVGELDQSTGITALSFVEEPAVERLFVALAKRVPVKMHTSKHKQILTGVVLIPDQLIYRSPDFALGECYLKFSAKDIERMALKMMRTPLALSTTTHQHEAPLKGNYLTEIWLVEDPKRDKAVALGLGELPKGTLVASYKITDAKYWREQVLTGKVKGFSLEGLFNYNTLNMKKPNVTPAKAKTALKATNKTAAFFKNIAAFLEGESTEEAQDLVDVAKTDEVDAGEPFLVFTLAEGSEVFVDSEGFATMDNEQMPPGEHALADGNVLVIDADGYMVVATEEAEETTTEETAEAALAAARTRGAEFLAALGKDKKKPNANNAKIKALEMQIAKLKGEPSTKKARQSVAAVDMSKMKPHEKMAHVIRMRNERLGK